MTKRPLYKMKKREGSSALEWMKKRKKRVIQPVMDKKREDLSLSR